MWAAMDYGRMLAELFQEEDRAREMASRLMHIAQTAPEAAVAERPSLLAFLRGPMEHHMAYEERAIFPALVQRGLAPEVQVAQKHHAAVRQAADNLAAMEHGDKNEVARQVFEAARLMLHHTNFEGDYIYPELTHEAWLDLMKESVR
jgi:iron-sulfur cluster repair protein YtfE (RIC family)